MLRLLCFLALLAALAVAAGLAFAAAAGQASVPPTLLAAKDARTAAAAAAPSGADSESAKAAGTNIGDILKSWGGSLLLAIAGLRGLVALAKRDFGEGISLLAIAVVVGGFVYAPDQVKGLIVSLWRPISGG